MTQKASNQAIKPVKELTEQEINAQIALTGNLANLAPERQMSYYVRYCQHLGLDPITRPFDLLTTFEETGTPKTVLYANASCSAQLADKRQITYGKPETEFNKDLGILTIRVEARIYLDNGHYRACWRSGVAHIEGLKGKRLENAIKKAETQAHRRVTLALCGVAMPDESEIEDIPNAQIIRPIDIPTAEEIFDTPRPLPDTPLPDAWVADTPARELADAEISNKIGAELGAMAKEIKKEAPAPQPQKPASNPDPTPGIRPTLSAAQQKAFNAVMSACKEHGKDRADVWHLINQLLGRKIQRSADLTDEEAEKVFDYLQTCATQWTAEKEQDNQVIKYDPKNRAHGAAAGKELDRLVLKFAMLGVKTPDLEQLIAGLAYNELGREIENRFALKNEECEAMNELLKAEIAKLEAQKAAPSDQQTLDQLADESTPDFG